MLLELSTFRFVQIFVVQLGLGLFFLYLGVKIIKRDKKKLNVLIFMFYLFIFISMLLNVIYATMSSMSDDYETAVNYLHFWTLFFSFMSFPFLLVFNLILYKSEKVFDLKKQLVVFLVLLAANISAIALVPDHLTMNTSTDWYPKYDSVYFLVQIFLLSAAVIPMIYYAVKVMQKFKSPDVKQKFKSYVLGITTQTVAGYGILISNFIFNDTFRNIWTFVSLALVITTCITVYRGLAKQLSKK